MVTNISVSVSKTFEIIGVLFLLLIKTEMERTKDSTALYMNGFHMIIQIFYILVKSVLYIRL